MIIKLSLSADIADWISDDLGLLGTNITGELSVSELFGNLDEQIATELQDLFLKRLEEHGYTYNGHRVGRDLSIGHEEDVNHHNLIHIVP
jgi:hypothetical protein